jgi:SpoVK/Ycf46/Vps4 family AAA+-type ATPase
VLWIDEIDKAFWQHHQRRRRRLGHQPPVFGSLITWMQEKTSPVFIVATANNVPLLPPELLRKGRFDEIFSLTYPPTPSARRSSGYTCSGCAQPPAGIRPGRSSSRSSNFSGAEIEQAIVDAMYNAFGGSGSGARRDFTQEDILQAIRETVPLASIAREQIESLKCWAAQAGARVASQDAQVLQEMKQCFAAS